MQLPGTRMEEKVTKLGPGLLELNQAIYCTKAGVLKSASGGRLWLDTWQKRYVPALNEPVLGTVVSRHGEFYKVDIGAAHAAALGVLSFEGATKRTRPHLEVGALVYGRISLADKDMEPELECMGVNGLALGFGELKGGYLVPISLWMARQLLDKSFSLIVFTLECRTNPHLLSML